MVRSRRFFSERKATKSIHGLRQHFLQRAVAGIKLLRQLLGHVEAIDVLSGGLQQGCEQRVDRSLAVELREAAGLEDAAAVAEQHHRPVRSAGVLTVGVVARVDDQRLIHHRAVAFGDSFQCLHDANQHSAVVLADFDPDRVIGLLHVPEIVPLLFDSDSFPRTENLAAP